MKKPQLGVKGVTGGSLGIPRPDTNRGKSQVQERRLMRRFRDVEGAETTPNSGARPLPSQKGDLQSRLFVWEAKRTESNKLVITSEVITKITREARRAPGSRLPLLAFEVSELPDDVDKDWICVSAGTFKWMLESMKIEASED